MSPLVIFFLSSVAIYLLYNVAITIYSVYFGPLSKVPGPKYVAFTRLVLSYHMITGGGEVWIAKMHEKYGDTCRLTPDTVSFANGAAWKPIYGNAPGSRFQNLEKDRRWYYRGPPDQNVASVSSYEHVRHHKNLAPAFSDKALVEQEPLIRGYVDQMIANLRAVGPNLPTDIVKQYNFATFDIMADLIFGRPLGCLENSEYTAWVGMIFGTLTAFTFLIEINYAPWLKAVIMALLPPSVKKMRDDHFQHTIDRVNERLEKQVDRPDIISLVQKQDLPQDQRLSKHELYANAQVFMFAGTETTATLMSGLTYFLLQHPDKLARLKQEVRSAYKSADEINSVNTRGLPYLNACLSEGGRVYPAAPLGLPRLIPKGGYEINGYHLPENTIVYVHQLSTYHNPRNFTRPKEFIPERWLKSDDGKIPEEFINDDRSCFNPFSVGPRTCIGLNLATMEMRLLLATVIYNFDLKLCDEKIEWTKQRSFALWEKGPLLVTVESAT